MSGFCGCWVRDADSRRLRHKPMTTCPTHGTPVADQAVTRVDEPRRGARPMTPPKPAADLGPAVVALRCLIHDGFRARTPILQRGAFRGDGIRSLIAAVRVLRREQEAGEEAPRYISGAELLAGFDAMGIQFDYIGPCGCDAKRDPWTRCDHCADTGWQPPGEEAGT